MKNESKEEMIAELKSSPFKLIFLAVVAFAGLAALFAKAFPEPEFIDLTYDGMMKEIYLSEMTTAQQSQKKKELAGKYVRWKGYVVDVEMQNYGYLVRIGDDSSAMTDVFLIGVDEASALDLKAGQQIFYSGEIDQFQDGMLTGYVHLRDVSIQ
ncbi:MAG: hypothetical protein Unbinned8699contig1000_10 [Prokaryotic dsDNA virus sp.]|nr:MAG: hypothetical protein Unbinned8699contig1000_10 [Prokaryotic dsDNA virus sp.]|tara:strand:+ start:1231 stop:1692 length:462 start_codon:yes stop_codon:yes gene_type:complete